METKQIRPSTRPGIFKRQRIVNKRFQWMFIVFLLSIAAFIASIDMLFYEVFVNKVAEFVATSGLLAPEAAGPFLDIVQSLFFKLMGATIVIMLLGGGIFGLLVSHRVAGPIYRVIRVIDQLSKGEEVTVPVRLRQGDFFPELEEAMTKLIKLKGPDKRKPE